MKKLLSLLIILLAISSCEKHKHEPEPETRQTVFVYMPWSNNLLPYFNDNLSDFEKAISKGILKNERVIVFLATSGKKATMFEMKLEKGANVRVPLKEYTDPANTTAQGITSILNDVQSFAPANRYAMIIGCHGMGWLPVTTSRTFGPRQKMHWEYEGVPMTRYFGGTSSEFQTDVTTLATGIADAGMKMEYILFDDCYMSTIEVAYDLKEVTDYLIASPTEIMAYGFPYAVVAQHLVGEVDYQAVCDEFYNFYSTYSTPCGTIGVTNCSELNNLASVMKEINQRFTFDTSLLGSIQRMDGYTPIIFYDYGDYVAKLCDSRELLDRFDRQLERVVPQKHRRHTPTFYSMINGQKMDIETYSGVTISDPSINSWAEPKTETAWYKATH